MTEAARQKTVTEPWPCEDGSDFHCTCLSRGESDGGMAPFTISRRAPGPHDVQIEILYCGVCHSDLHTVRNEWESAMPTVYPRVPGHEIVGRVANAGTDGKKFKEGDLVAVGCMVDSCRRCASCLEGLEQYCENGMVLTYNGTDNHLGGHVWRLLGQHRRGRKLRFARAIEVGPSSNRTAASCRDHHVFAAAPLERRQREEGGDRGARGGHMGVKFAKAFGAHVVLFTTSPNKTADAKRPGADEAVVSKNETEMQKQVASFDFILDAVSANHDLNTYLNLPKRDGTLALIGAPKDPLPVGAYGFLIKRRSLAGSAIGGIRETQEMLDFCGEHGITADVEVIRVQQINEAYC